MFDSLMIPFCNSQYEIRTFSNFTKNKANLKNNLCFMKEISSEVVTLSFQESL